MDDRSKPAQRNDIPKIDAANNEAARGLRAVEAGAASDKPKETGDNLDANRANEEAANGFYTGTGRELVSVKGKGKGKFSLKGKGPIGLLIALIMGFGGLFAGAQLFQPFSLVAQFAEAFNSMHVTTNKRSDVFFRMQMGSGKYVNPIKGTLFHGDTFKISNKQRNRLAKQGIEVEGSGAGTVLKYKADNGDIKTVTAAEFKDTYRNDPDFFNMYNAGSMTWRGQISNWFNTVTTKFLQRNKITRNLFKDYIEKVNASVDGNSRKVALDLIAEGADKVDEGGVNVRKTEDEEAEVDEFDEDGKKIGSHREKTGNQQMEGSFTGTYGKGSFSRTGLKGEVEVRAKLTSIAEAYSGGSLSTAEKVANFGCLALNLIGGINLLVTAAQALQVINLVTAYTEAIDKTKIGLADEAPINELTTTLNETKKNEHTLYGESFGEDHGDRETTAMQAEGLAALYERRSVDGSDRSVRSFNISGNTTPLLGRIGASMAVFETCSVAKMVTNAISSIAEAVKLFDIGTCVLGIVGAIFSFGTSLVGCGKIIGKALLGLAVSATITALITTIIDVLAPIATSALTKDLISDIGGEDLGNALTSGANMYLGNTHRANGGSLANSQKYTEFALAQQDVIAEDARYERMNKSPFDITSKYTFLGTLLTQMMTFLNSNSLMSTVTTASSVVGSSIVALATPTARAFDVSSTLPNWEEYEKTCPYLASIGAVGDQFCNPYSITDISTIEEDPGEVINRVDSTHPVLKVNADSGSVLSKNFMDRTRSDNGVEVPIVNKNSDLAKYILYCDGRTSAFGFADQNIVAGVSTIGNVNTESPLTNSFVNGAIGSVPAIGDLVDVLQNAQALLNTGYISGKTCVAGNETMSIATPDWEEAKYYQRFIEDQSLAESSGLIEKSAVTAFLDEYYEENPLDNSYEGILARYSGLTKDNVVALLEIIDYGNYIANYDPTTRYQFGEPEVVMPDKILFDTESIIAEAPAVILTNAISFADVRNRSFVV